MASRPLVAAAGVLLLVVAIVLAFRPDAGADIGDLDLTGETASPAAAPTEAPASPTPTTDPTQALPTPTPAPSPEPRATQAPTASPSLSPQPVPDIGVRSARIADLPREDPGTRPARLRLPSLDLDVSVVPVGVASDGQMEIPENVDETGWYEFGPRPGQAGHAVVAGHVDDRVQGVGPFRRLVDLSEGDDVVVEAADGTTTTWRVSARRTIDKAALEADDLFTRTGPPRLVLVTCGGDFDADVRSYRSNVVVVADLL